MLKCLPWADADSIVAGIQLPKIPNQEFCVADFGEDLEKNIQPAIHAAVEACVAGGGGRVTIPLGRFLCRGPISLYSGVELHLCDGAYLKFSPNPEDYLPNVYCRWEGVNLYNYSPLIYAIDAENIAITGNGVIDGGAEIWSTFRQQQNESRLEAWRVGADAVPLAQRQFGATHKLRPPMMHLVNCQRVLIEDVMLTNSPFWMIHPVYSQHITIRRVHCHSMFINNDGVDIDSCAEVLIENSSFSTGDDAIAMKAGRDLDAWTTGIPTRNVVIRNCDIPEALHGFAIGSDMSGGIENIYVENLRIGKIREEAIQLKTNKDRGGAIRNVYLRDIQVERAGNHFIYITNDYHSYQGGQAPTELQGISLERISCCYAESAFHLQGLEEKPIRDLRLKDIHVAESPCSVSCNVNCQSIEDENISVNGEIIDLNLEEKEMIPNTHKMDLVTDRPLASAPLYEDPVCQGPADPRLFWNPLENNWWMLYTARNATHEGPGVEWGFGIAIGAASSGDGGASWMYRGTLDLRVKADGETYWGPEIVCHDGVFHLFPVYYEGGSTTWDVPYQPLAHFVSTDLKHWRFEGFLPLEANKVIEGCVHRMPDGKWRIWYRRDVHFETAEEWTEESQSMTTWVAESDDLYKWNILGQAVADIPHEGAKVFELGGYFWMLTDAWQGLAVYRSDDGDSWQRQEGFVLDAGGSREQDGARAHNPCIRVIGDTAYVVYHTHPEERDYEALWADGAPFELRRSVIQVAEAHVNKGILCIERNHARFELPVDGP